MKILIKKLIIKFAFFLRPLINLLPSKFKDFARSLYINHLKPLAFNDKELGISGKILLYKDQKIINALCKTKIAGVNILGFPRGAFGLAHQTRIIGNSLMKQNIQTAFYDCNFAVDAKKIDDSVDSYISKNLDHKANIFSCNSDVFDSIIAVKGNVFKNHYNIHYGAWELEQYPKQFFNHFNYVHEFWAMSSFLRDAVEKISSIPVYLMPLAIDFEMPENFSRKDFNLPQDRFLFIFSFDLNSKKARKNPEAVVKAFLIAFPKENSDVGLVIKISRKDYSSEQAQALRMLKILVENSGHSNIYFIDQILSSKAARALINICDVYISLHRSEGFGLGMAEAMKMGKPVIATNYSGNLDFTNDETACMVDYKLTQVNPGDYFFYDSGQFWAEADVNHASFHMKQLFENQNFYEEKAVKGKAFIDQNYNYEVIGRLYKKRLEELYLI